MKVADYIHENAGIDIDLELSYRDDPCDAFRVKIYRGSLSDVPGHLRDLDVIDSCYSMSDGHSVLMLDRDQVIKMQKKWKRG